MSKEQKQFLTNVMAPIISAIVVGAFAAFVSFKVLSAQFEDYKKTTDEKFLDMKDDIGEIKEDVKFLVRNRKE